MGIWDKLFGKQGAKANDTALGLEQMEELTVQPISQERMCLLGVDPQHLSLMEISLAPGILIMTDDGAGGVCELHPTPEDIQWAKKVDVHAAKAQEAGERGNHQAAIQHYREALKLAPGYDQYLMSVGCCYANMGQLRIGLKYLQRAAEISPNNERIRNNLAGVLRSL